MPCGESMEEMMARWQAQAAKSALEWRRARLRHVITSAVLIFLGVSGLGCALALAFRWLVLRPWVWSGQSFLVGLLVGSFVAAPIGAFALFYWLARGMDRSPL